MRTPYDDSGTVQVVLERLVKLRLPRALALKKRVDAGKKIDEYDIRFLKRVIKDSAQFRSLTRNHPELRPLMSKVSSLYSDIVSKALENEKNA